MKRIGLSGTNWTGKSTTLDYLFSKYPNIFDSRVVLSNLVSKCPYPTVRGQTLDASQWMQAQVTAKITESNSKEGLELFDRSPIDILAFTHYAAERDNISIPEPLLNSIVSLLYEFDTIFFLNRSPEWGTFEYKKTDDISFALLMEFYMKKVVNLYNIPIVSLPWDYKKRAELIYHQTQVLNGR